MNHIRKISKEMSQDIEAYGINIEAELVSLIMMEEELLNNDMKIEVPDVSLDERIENIEFNIESLPFAKLFISLSLYELIKLKRKKIIRDHCQ